METKNLREKRIQKRAEILQEECHMFVSEVVRDSSASHQDVTNVWIFRKIAELEAEIESLHSTKRK